MTIPGCPVTVTYSSTAKSIMMSAGAACLDTPTDLSAYHRIDKGTFFDFAGAYPFDPRAVSDGPTSGLQLPIVTVQRFWSQAFNNAHFYTASPVEAAKILNTDENWTYENTAFGAYAVDGQGCATAGLSAVYRFYSQVFQSHFFTSNVTEKDSIQASDKNWSYEGVAYCAPTAATADTAPLYRFWSANFGKHFYTADGAEAHQLRTADANWAYEGIAYNVLP